MRRPDFSDMNSDDWALLGDKVVLAICCGVILAVTCGWLR